MKIPRWFNLLLKCDTAALAFYGMLYLYKNDPWYVQAVVLIVLIPTIVLALSPELYEHEPHT